MKIPAVSVIIPMYNAGKYVGECLDSLLAQTLKDFEVVVVDDCSTDDGAAIVESYAPKFDGRLILSRMPQNSGSGAKPRNKGAILSHGKYLLFMDADDALIGNALEELYTLAEDYDADVVYYDRYYRAAESDIQSRVVQGGNQPVKPTLEPDALETRVQGILKGSYRVTPWCKFVLRRLIIENELFFPHVKISEDNIWTYGLVIYAKKFLRIPNVVYVYRSSEGSMMRQGRTPQQTINFWLDPILLGLKSLNDMMSRHDFFKANPQYRYSVLEKFIDLKYCSIVDAARQLPTHEVCATIKEHFADRFGEHIDLIALLSTALNTYQRRISYRDWKIKKLEQSQADAEKRIAALESELQRLKS